MITLLQAQQFLASQGITGLPDFIIEAWVDRANTVNACLEANYDPSTAILIQSYLLSLYGLVQVDQRISSQTAPSGASRSFKFGSLDDRWRSTMSMLSSLDTAGCVTPLIPANPSEKAYGFVGVFSGKCRSCE